MKNRLFTFLLLLLGVPAFAQYSGFSIFGTRTNPFLEPYMFITLDTMDGAKTLSDINAKYRADWVDSYISVEVATYCRGTVKKAVGKNDVLTPQQLELIRAAGDNCEINIAVNYIPKNTLKDNPPRQMNFSLAMIPIYEAQFPGGQSQLENYLRENTVGKISEEKFKEVELVRVKFNVNEQGQVTDVDMITASKDPAIDKMVLDALCNMPQWTPARDAKGNQIVEEFEFTMGNLLLYGCYQYAY